MPARGYPWRRRCSLGVPTVPSTVGCHGEHRRDLNRADRDRGRRGQRIGSHPIARTVKVAAAAAVGVPDSTPVAEFRLNPAGKPPLATANAGAGVPVAAGCSCRGAYRARRRWAVSGEHRRDLNRADRDRGRRGQRIGSHPVACAHGEGGRSSSSRRPRQHTGRRVQTQPSRQTPAGHRECRRGGTRGGVGVAVGGAYPCPSTVGCQQ